jgi:magnesium transporter
MNRDLASLSEYATYESHKVNFLLDATLGVLNIEQNNIIKIFTVASVAMMPPTLIASIYGMNFDVMPELKWGFGYPLAVLLMVISAALPFIYFKRKGWL